MCTVLGSHTINLSMNKITQIKSEIDLYFILITGTSFVAILASLFFLGQGYTNVYPHLFYIPIILAAYRYLNRGILFGIFLSALYLILHIIMLPDPEALTEAVTRAVVMAGTGVITGMLSGKLLGSEKRFRMLADNAADIIYRYDLHPVTHFSFVSNAVTGITGYTPEEYYNDPMLGGQIVHPDDRHLLESIRDGKEMADPPTVRWVRKDGGIVYVEQSYTSIRDQEGQLIAIEGIGRDITRQKLAEEKLAESELLYRTLFEESLEGVYLHDLNGVIIDVNRMAVLQSGYSHEEYRSMTIFDLHPPGGIDSEVIIHQWKHWKIGERHTFEREHVRKDGSIHPVEVVTGRVDYADSKIVLALVRDITGRKAIEEELRVSEEKYRALVENALEGILIVDMQGTILFANYATAKLSELEDPSELIGRKVLDFIAPESQNAVVSDFEEVVHGHDAFPATYNARAASGRSYIIKSVGRRITFEGKPAILVSLHDITEQRFAEKSQKRLASIVESSNDAILSLDTDANLLTWNRGAEEIFGWRAEEIIGKQYSLMIPTGEDRSLFDRRFKEMLATKKPKSREVNRLHRSGRILRISLSMSPIIDRDGNIIAISGILRDITEQKRMEETLQKNSLYTRALIEASLDPLVTISPKGLITDVNRATEMVTGLHRNQLVGSDFANYFTDPDKARKGYKEAFNSGFVKDYALTIHHTSGETIDVLYNATVYSDESGAVQGVFAAARDVTKEKLMMQQIQESLLEKETLLREIHHRVKNNMQVVSSLLHLQALTIGDERLMGAFQDSENQIASMALVHEHLYRSEKLAWIDAAKYLKRLSHEIRQSFAPNQDITITHRIDSITFDIDTATYCGLIVEEIISNALKHAFYDRKEGWIGISLEKDEEGSIILTLEDDGVGMPGTIDPRTGSTLGIELIRTFVRQIGGSYSCTPRAGGGTSWVVRFRDENTSP